MLFFFPHGVYTLARLLGRRALYFSDSYFSFKMEKKNHFFFLLFRSTTRTTAEFRVRLRHQHRRIIRKREGRGGGRSRNWEKQKRWCKLRGLCVTRSDVFSFLSPHLFFWCSDVHSRKYFVLIFIGVFVLSEGTVIRCCVRGALRSNGRWMTNNFVTKWNRGGRTAIYLYTSRRWRWL